jgi:nematocidal protein AidA
MSRFQHTEENEMALEKGVDSASMVAINVLVVIDTEYVKAHYSKQSNPNWNNPVGIDHNSQYMIANDPRGINSGQGKADLDFNANVGDYVGFAGVSIYQNSDDAVIIYGIEKGSGDSVFNQFNLNVVTRKKAVIPDPDSTNHNGLPPLHGSLNFSTLESKVARSGKEFFLVRFGLYTLDSNGQNQSLYGYFSWDPTIRVP